MSCKNSNVANRRKAKNFLELVAIGEPFRLLFPIGTIIGVFGISLWPLYIYNIIKTYPGTTHPRIMIEGFLTSFVVGFIGTALPRLLDIPKMTLIETFCFSALLLWSTWLHFTNQTFWGDQIFFFVLVVLIGGLVVRSIFRKDTPPPAFVLVAMGILSALIGCVIQMIIHIDPIALPDWIIPMGRLLLYQAYLLLPIMGIGAFILPRFFDLPNRQSFPESYELPQGWIPRAFFALSCGLSIILSMFLEVNGFLNYGYGLRAITVFVYFFREVPIYKARFSGGTLAFGLRLALFAIPFGYTLLAIWPDYKFSFLHIIFITGFGLMVFIVASRVLLGHSGMARLFGASIKPVLITISLLTVAMITRVTADWMPDTRMTHYAYAAFTWIIGATVWATTILPRVLYSDEEK